MSNQINTLHGIHCERDEYPTVILDVDLENNVSRRLIVSDDTLKYSDYTLKSLLAAGIDPSSISVSIDNNNRLDSFSQLQTLASSLDSTDSK